MPQGDGTGPRQGLGRGRQGGPYAAGPGGECICPQCGTTIKHTPGQACSQSTCPKCGSPMTRKM